MPLRFLTMWMAWILTTSELITHGLSHETAYSQNTTATPPTNQELEITAITATTGKTSRTQATTATPLSTPTHESQPMWTGSLTSVTERPHPETQFQALSTHAAENENSSDSVSTPDHEITSLKHTTVSSYPDNMSTDDGDNLKRGTWSSAVTTGYKTHGPTSGGEVHVSSATGVNHWETQTNTETPASLQSDGDVQTPSWTQEMSEATDPQSVSTVAPDNLTKGFDVTQSSEAIYSPTIEQRPVSTTLTYTTTQASPDTHTASPTLVRNSTAIEVEAVTSGAIDLNSEESTTGHFNVTPTAVNKTWVRSYEGERPSTESLEEPPFSSTVVNTVSTAFPEIPTEQEGEEQTAALRTTQTTLWNLLDVTERDISTDSQATYTHSQPEDTWSTFFVTTSASEEGTNTSTTMNVSRPNQGDTEFVPWPNCSDEGSPSRTRSSSKMVCFIMMWSLAMTATVFLGITVFLWVRLSVLKQRAKRKRGLGLGGGQGFTKKETESLWAKPSATTEERVEFWYANGSTLEADKKAREREKVGRSKRKSKKEKGKEGDMWIQPRVTMEDISEFWYANGRNGRAGNTERMEQRP